MPLLTRLQDVATRPRVGLASAAVWIAICIVLPTVLRLALDPLLGPRLWYVTYFPAALVGTLFLGWRAGLAVVVISVLAANYLFVPPRLSFSLQRGEAAGTVVFLLSEASIVLVAGLLRAALVRLSLANQREQALNIELQHRIKNTLAVVQGLVAQTVRRGADDPQEFQRLLQGRLQALGRAHDLLASGRWRICELPELAERALAPFREHGGVTIAGPPCTLRPESCVPLVLALHELATNAVKYGALSVSHGRAALTWSETAGDEIRLRWREHDGPEVGEPKRRGLGTRLLTRQAGLEDVTLRFAPTGVECEMAVKLAEPSGQGGTREPAGALRWRWAAGRA